MSLQSVYKNIFNESPGENTVEKLVELTEKYPYFDLAHLMLLKYTKPSDPAYAERGAKAALFMQNEFQLREMLELHELEEPISNEEHPLTYFPSTELSWENSDSETDNKNIDTANPELDDALVNEIPASSIHDSLPEEDPVTPTQTDKSSESTEPAEDKVMVNENAETDPPPKKEDMLFEPLHTTDYFASQGIKLSEDQQGSDKLGKQLRSFTDWLKTMKKLHETKVPLHNAPIDRTVEHMAEKSNKEDLVITEAMAEAYIAQGKINKAREIYHKLSLLNPAKTSFFAAKIEQLNGK